MASISHQHDRSSNKTLSCVEITRPDDAEVELSPVAAGNFPPLKKLKDSSELKLCCNLRGKSCVTCSLWYHDFSVAFRTCFSGSPGLWFSLGQPRRDNSHGTGSHNLSITGQGGNVKKSCYPSLLPAFPSLFVGRQGLKVGEVPGGVAGCCIDLG